MRRRMSGSFSSSMNGPVFVSLWFCESALQNNSKWKNGGAHGKDDDSNGPAVDELVITLIFFRLIDDFWREVTWRPTHRLRTEPSLLLSIPAQGLHTP